jgi:hypothetical protein
MYYATVYYNITKYTCGLCTALRGVKEERNILHTMKGRKANWIGHILRRNCLLKDGIEGKVLGKAEGTGRRGRRPEELLDDLKETRSYWNLKEDALDRTVWRTRCRIAVDLS